MFLLISRPILGRLVQFNTHWKAEALTIPVQYSIVVSNKWVKSYKHLNKAFMVSPTQLSCFKKRGAI